MNWGELGAKLDDWLEEELLSIARGIEGEVLNYQYPAVAEWDILRQH